MDCKDLEVFILTYNRAEWLKIQLESICNQTATGFKIYILNNASTDNTIDIINDIKNKHPDRDIEIITHTHNIGNPNNFKKTQEIASKKYCAIFHDDDCVHPEYIERAMQCLYANQDAVMASCYVEAYYNVTADNWCRKEKSYYLINNKDFTFLMCQPERPSFAASIYRTDIYKSCTYRNDLCGKIHDLPFMFDICSKGKSVILRDTYLRYRLSPAQDSAHPETGPFPNQVANALYFISLNIKKNKLLSTYRLYNFAIFLKMVENSLSSISKKEFKKMLVTKGVINKKDLLFIKFFNSLLNKIANKIVKNKFKSFIKN